MRAPSRPIAAMACAVLLAAACSGEPTRSEVVPSTAVLLPGPSAATTTAAPAPKRPHVMVVVMENREYGAVIGSSSAPYVNQLAARFGLALRSYAAGHPSLPNYLDLIAGSRLGISSDCTGCSVDAQVLPDQLAAAGVPWAAYAEGLPAPCSTVAGAPGGYAKKHNPFVYVRHLVESPQQCARVRPFTSLAGDLAGATPPDFVWVSPNLCHDGHDCNTATADAWLRSFIEPVLHSAWYADGGILLLTWDEGTSGGGCCQTASGGHIPTLVLSARTAPGARLGTPVDHAGLLRTVEDLYGVPHLGDAACPCSGSLAPLVG